MTTQGVSFGITVANPAVITVAAAPSNIDITVPGPQGPSGLISDQPLTTNTGATGTINLDVTQNGSYDLTLVGNVTFTLTNSAPTKAPSIVIVLRQDATGGRTITWPAGTRWALGQPNIPTTPNSLYVVSLMVVNGTVMGFPAGEML